MEEEVGKRGVSFDQQVNRQTSSSSEPAPASFRSGSTRRTLRREGSQVIHMLTGAASHFTPRVRLGERVPNRMYDNSFKRNRSWLDLDAWRIFSNEIIPSLLRTPMAGIIVGGLFTNALVITLYAAFMYAAPISCLYFHDDPGDLDPVEVERLIASGNATAEMHSAFGSQKFSRVLWFSMHSFTTIGYGSAFPTCFGTELLVFLEHYTATVIQGAFVAIFLFKFLMPRPLVRFSSKCLVNGDRLAFRLVRESSYQLSNCKIEVRCRTISALPLTSRGGIDHDQRSADSLLNATLQWVAIKNDTMLHLDAWEVHHDINADSPLYEHLQKTGKLDPLIIELDVSLTVFDTAYSQEVTLHTSYHRRDVVVGARFQPMVRTSFVNVPEDLAERVTEGMHNVQDRLQRATSKVAEALHLTPAEGSEEDRPSAVAVPDSPAELSCVSTPGRSKPTPTASRRKNRRATIEIVASKLDDFEIIVPDAPKQARKRSLFSKFQKGGKKVISRASHFVGRNSTRCETNEADAGSFDLFPAVEEPSAISINSASCSGLSIGTPKGSPLKIRTFKEDPASGSSPSLADEDAAGEESASATAPVTREHSV